MLEPGIVLDDRYRLENRLGMGGMGDVWRATDLLLGRAVAIKAARGLDPEFLARFQAEAQIMASVHHPGIVDIYDYGEKYLVMEWVDGPSLADRLQDGPIGVNATMSIVAQIGRALQAAHDRGVVHRDVKPGNLLVTPDGSVRLVDFGVARASTANLRLTATNQVPGTVGYMAPEQAMGHPVTEAADIYALGAVAYHCLAGHPPFGGETQVEIALHHINDEPPPLPGHVPPHVRALVATAMAKNPADRFPSAAAMAAAAGALHQPDGSTLRDALPVAGFYSPGRAAVQSGHGRTAVLDETMQQSHPSAYRAPARSRRPYGTAAAVAGGVMLAVIGIILMLASLRDTPSGNVPPVVPNAESSTPGPTAPTAPTTAPATRPTTASTSASPTRTSQPPPPPTTTSPPAPTPPEPTGTAQAGETTPLP